MWRLPASVNGMAESRAVGIACCAKAKVIDGRGGGSVIREPRQAVVMVPAALGGEARQIGWAAGTAPSDGQPQGGAALDDGRSA